MENENSWYAVLAGVALVITALGFKDKLWEFLNFRSNLMNENNALKNQIETLKTEAENDCQIKIERMKADHQLDMQQLHAEMDQMRLGFGMLLKFIEKTYENNPALTAISDELNKIINKDDGKKDLNPTTTS